MDTAVLGTSLKTVMRQDEARECILVAVQVN